ncbi:CPBP family intramembrane glutamic endopeptidase [Chitinimonas sp. BJB300]|uniref:CPBP family intramembrane glutamic endopeptidase n=1 Tax=Chitinimonas sp. BJB300 TaxID=1559339 RepID=UPI000C0F16C1|nr:CPBP family intramembrane glutamic endopeptidase [Chitinimonas sp. BJB300]PHV12551.1 hypothetical protein CSQ89_05005 [Chitinimonas sp. BJB300]TSJ90053.1 CPBP family intramembrane metalloprotease [Chitinimonas sp. BJB300]
MQKNETFPTALEAIFLIIFLFIIEYLLGALFYDFRSSIDIDIQQTQGVISLLGNGVIFCALLYYKNMSYGSLFHFSKNSPLLTTGLLILPISLTVPALTLFMWTSDTLLTSLFPPSEWFTASYHRMMSNGVISIITVCILAPILEEMLFRGIILRSFLYQYRKWPAIIGSSFIFGFAHLNIYQFVVGVVIGSILGWLYERTHSLYPGIFLHSLYNSVCMYLYYTFYSEDLSYSWEPSTLHWVTAFIFAFIGTSLLRRLLSSPKAATILTLSSDNNPDKKM